MCETGDFLGKDRALDPAPPAEVLAAADRLRYRDFLIILVIVNRREMFPDNWIYIHSPDVVMGRIQNFKNWSPDMVPDPAMTSLGLEYFVNVGDELWNAEDEELVKLGARELATLGLAEEAEVVDGAVIRMPKAYPVYDGNYRESVDTLREYLLGFRNLQVIGRNGQHRYNNQDHSMLAGIQAARNVVGGEHDVWAVNLEGDYLEEDRRAVAAGRLVPEPVGAIELEEMVRRAFARYDPLALGLSLGTVFGLGLFLATAILLLKGGDPIVPNLSLLGVYFLGYDVTWPGALLGALEAGLLGLAPARAEHCWGYSSV